MDAFEAIKATFFQECDELLADLEQKLMLLEQGHDVGRHCHATRTSLRLRRPRLRPTG